MTPNRLPVRVYWEDTDAGGVVYHASYLRFMERGRTEFLRGRGVVQSTLQADSGITFVVAEMKIRFRAPAKLDDELTVDTTMIEGRGASMVLAQTITRGTEVLVEADVTCAAISREGRPVRLPAELKARLG